jgi:hypothetical protein
LPAPAGVSVSDATSALASFEDGELIFEGQITFRDASEALVGPAYAYRYGRDDHATQRTEVAENDEA